MATDTQKLDKLIEKYAAKKGILIPLLQDIQNLEGYLSRESMKYVAEKMKMREAEIYGVATFYSMFRLKPLAKHIIRVCKGTACHVSGANNISTAIRNVLDLTDGEDQSADGLFTFIEVACLGCCSLAPVIMIDDKTYGKLTSEKVTQIVKSYY
ncbi:MAG: NADH-quinone oxidoreductase subunit NuoE [Candidatus Cloacimonadales bacterium]|jgi:NADH-quinone oxidoreductase subunit E|nr:NADH-quinone oxidoreductase subunit NuoE [Candidatus Cloacimonadota bacterium]MDD2649605.1 NADH-quinone oxidoreductase subunit NuoE [Candidatus Cloacimonadota bacterium]MDD3501877.1 NADH-quinone oxidoreductase subunit NuoE [Candidatus Cloacimonadota bacterium]MDX9977278.1 NADH-quinone oxidoreductase subunit NuoE [Candidatus Cloacimonadales bacterium]